MTKISIIGAAGTLGAAIAFQMANKEKVRKICLIDIDKNLLKNHLMDLQNAYPDKNIYIGDYAELRNSTIIIISAGVPNRNNISNRNVFLKGNLSLFKEFGEKIRKYSPDSLIVTVSNPVDLLNYYLYKEFRFSRKQLIGYTMNDSLRFEWALREVLYLYDDKIVAPVLGEHGETQVPIFSQITRNNELFVISASKREEIYSKLQNWFVEFNSLHIDRTTGWTTARGIDLVVDKLLGPTVSSIIGSTILDGEYGEENVSLGAPILVNLAGVQKVEEWKLSESEWKAFKDSAQAVRNLIKDL